MMPHTSVLTALAIKVMVDLGVVLVAVALAAWFARRLGLRPGAAGSRYGPEVIATTHLAPRQSLHLVRVGDQAVLVGASREGLCALGNFPLPAGTVTPFAEPGASAGEPREGSVFLDYVEAALRGGKKNPPTAMESRRPRRARASVSKLAP